MVRWTRAVGVFTGALALVAALQFWAFVQSERALLSLVGLEVNGGAPKAGDLSVHVLVRFTNSGRIAASAGHFALGLRFGDLPQRPEYNDLPTFGSQPIPAGGGTEFYPTAPLSRALTQDEVDKVKSGALRMSLFGYIKYSDAFSFFGTTTIGFCSTYIPPPLGEAKFYNSCPEPSYTYAN
ncbi:MAG TPA: hypothetical protein VFE60_25185 [Roseiarcus sp.]|jgi:hypothetical protein|nr:hypothetical protein [Roseiarcus sp.]